MKIVIAGGRGFIGRHLAHHLKDHQLIILSRAPHQSHYWNPAERQIAPHLMENVDVVINLAGESVVGRWSQAKLNRMRESRFQATNFLADLMESHPPKLYIGASGMGFYGDRGDEVLTEQSASGQGYLSEMSRIWEQIPKRLSDVRQVYLRLGLVLGKGGALQRMLPPFKWGMGGRLGSGEQWVSWIAIQDVCRIVEHAIEQQTLSGPLNTVAPTPVTNLEFTKTLGHVLRRPTLLPVPEWALKLFFRGGAQVFTASLRLAPEALLKSGFTFDFPTLEPAFRALVY